MTKIYHATQEGPSIFNAMAIGVAFNIFRGKMREDSEGAPALIEAFAAHHPNFSPKDWETLVSWLHYFSNPKDIERILAPVLLQLHQKSSLEDVILEELAILIERNGFDIKKGKIWEGLSKKDLIPFLDALSLEGKTNLLAQLRVMLDNNKEDLNADALKALLKQQDWFNPLVQAIKADKNTLKKAYTLKNLKPQHLKGLVAHLGIQLAGQPKKEEYDNIINLKQQGNNWQVLCEDSSKSYFNEDAPEHLEEHLDNVVSPTPEQLTEHRVIKRVIIENPGMGNCGFYAFAMGLMYIIQFEKNLNKRTLFELWQQHDSTITEEDFGRIVDFDFNNRNVPLLNKLQHSLRRITYNYQVLSAKQACAKTISFHLIAELIDRIQKENGQGKRDLFNLLQRHIPTLKEEHYQKICAYNPDPNRGNYDLFNSLRSVLGNKIYELPVIGSILRDLKFKEQYCRPIEQLEIYSQLVTVYNGEDISGEPINPRFNDLVENPRITSQLAKIDRSLVRDQNKNEHLVPVFLELFYGKDIAKSRLITEEMPAVADSPILEGFGKILVNFHWAAHKDLNSLAAAFNVDLNAVEEDGPRPVITAKQYKAGYGKKHAITIVNHGNVHWTTELRIARDLTPIQRVNLKEPVVPRAGNVPIAPVTGPLSDPKETVAPLTDPEQPSSDKPAVAITLPGQTQRITLFKPELGDGLPSSEDLHKIARDAALKYVRYNQSIVFSFWHHHGQKGIDRAIEFVRDFYKKKDKKEAYEFLIGFLSDDKKGNTHPHSFRTMLLHELLENEDETRTLKMVSADFKHVLQKLIKRVEPLGVTLPVENKYNKP